jgi:hypothetical protein
MTGIGQIAAIESLRATVRNGSVGHSDERPLQVSEFYDSYPAMNLKRRRSFGDPFLLVAFLQIGQPGKFRFCGDPAFWEFVLSCE